MSFMNFNNNISSNVYTISELKREEICSHHIAIKANFDRVFKI